MGNFTFNGDINVVQIQQKCDNSQIIYDSDDFIKKALTVFQYIQNNLQDGIFSDINEAIANIDTLEKEINKKNKRKHSDNLFR